MELDVQTGICNNCGSIERCTKSCILHIGKALVDFIQRIDTTETKIGEYSSKKKGEPYDLVVYGHQLFDLSSPSWILTDINTILDVSDKFLTAYDKNAFQIANIYCKHVGMSAQDTKTVTDKIKAINNNLMLVLPFKPHSNCEIDLTVNGNVEKKKEANINYIKWITNKETHKINCTIGFDLSNSSQIVKMDIKDYIDKFRLSQMEMVAKGARHDKNLIKITDYGIFKPILIKEGNVSIAVDATYVYYNTPGDTRIIGFWDENDKLVIDKNIKSKAINKIKDNLTYIKNHKKYMAPYMLFEPNVIEIK